ncbi:hypothetical protein BCV70DRAFT_197836 [Testicularia cyperi]|uniref:Uncharacterized protein n=1 Tax=Testicularia cyperi TaxID=1882483 RepID=A0A317XZC2_9BASI|nr:hypothetical protein BCV70DRAFT_197836 [Testicularia cyperi]
MPSTSARQRNKRALEATGSPSKPLGRSSGSLSSKSRNAAGGDASSRLQSLLYILLATTVLLLGYQIARFYYRSSSSSSNKTSPHDPLAAWTKAKYGAADPLHDSSVLHSPGSFTPENSKAKAVGAAVVSPPSDSQSSLSASSSSSSSSEQEQEQEQTLKEGQMEAQFDEDGNLDMATIQRMLDLLYRPARDGVNSAAHTAGKVLNAMVDDHVLDQAADHAEVDDESAP